MKSDEKRESYRSFEELDCLPCRIRTIAVVRGYYVGVEKRGRTVQWIKSNRVKKACTEVRRFVIKLLKSYPKEEKFALVDDMKRAAGSTTHNTCPVE